MWRALIAGVVFKHASVALLPRELSRNPALLDLCGFHPVPRKARRRYEQDPETGMIHITEPREHSSVSSGYNMSRFLVCLIRLEEGEGLLSGMVVALRERLMELIPDFGVHLGCDGKAIASHATGAVGLRTGHTSDVDANWGKHETTGVTADGKAWTKVKTWFGYGLHLGDYILDGKRLASDYPSCFLIFRLRRLLDAVSCECAGHHLRCRPLVTRIDNLDIRRCLALVLVFGHVTSILPALFARKVAGSCSISIMSSSFFVIL